MFMEVKRVDMGYQVLPLTNGLAQYLCGVRNEKADYKKWLGAELLNELQIYVKETDV